MSVNINVHGNSIRRLMLVDPERCRREELNRRKLLRLEQVRQQSKDIASQLRMRVNDERNRQIERIDQIKADEVRAWKQKQLGIMDDVLEECVIKVGEAQAAARTENELEKKRLEQQKVNRRLAAKRGREAMAKLESDKRKQAKSARKPPVTTKRPGSGKLGEPVNVATQVGESLNELQNTMDQSPLVGKKQVVRPLSTQNISSDTLSSSIEVAIQALQLAKTKPNYQFQNSPELVLPTNSSSNIVENNSQELPITLASDLISRRRQTNSNIGPLLGSSEAAISKISSSHINPQSEYLKDIQPTIPRPILPSGAIRKTPPPPQSKPIDNKRTLSPSKHPIRPNNNNPKTTPEVRSRPPTTFVPMFTKPSSTQLLVQGKSILPGGSERNSRNAAQLLPITESTSSHPPSAPFVQYYDHANRFSKEYEQDEHLVVQPEPYDSLVPNAMEAADMERRREEEFAAEEQLRRQKSDQRGQIALERERVRKDYDLMNAQLDQLSKQYEYAKTFAQPTHNYAESRLKQMAQDRQNAMNKLVEDVLPPKVQITCPRVARTESTESKGLNVADLDRPDRPTVSRVQSDDSCASIILGEIENVPNPRQHKSQTLKPARNDSNIVQTSKPTRSETSKSQVLGQENQTSAQLVEDRKQIEKRERDVKNKERKLEEKLMKMFQETQHQKSRQPAATSVRVQTDKCLEKDVRIMQSDAQDAPVQIIIQVNGGNKHISAAPDPLPNPQKILKTKKVIPLRDTANQVFPKTPLKPMMGSDTIPAADGSSTSTAYQSLPKVIRTQLTDVLAQKEKENQNPKTKQPPTSIATSTLEQYIRRLLGMSRASIDQLEVSDVSSVSTPGNSLINISSNVCHPLHDDETINDQHMSKLQTFIRDNHNFITDLEKSLREISMSSDEASNLKAVETAWMETLARKEKEIKMVRKVKKRDDLQQNKTVELPPPTTIKPILKKPASPKKVKVVESESRINLGKAKLVNHTERIESQTEKCNQRIADLNEMIVKVRREKQRLLESTYSSMGSSVSDPAQNSTEYLDIVRKTISEGSNDSSRTTTDLPSLSEERKLEASKQIGISRDSGLGGVSRPLTASDAAANSLDDRPIVINTDEESEPSAVIQERTKYSSNTVETIEASVHKRKPPSSLQRFGPQIEQLELGHDLSTIIEVDTPIATSRLNSSLNDAVKNISAEQQTDAKLQQLLFEISTNTRNKLKISNFPYDPTIGNDSILSNSNTKPPMQIQLFPSHASFVDGASGMIDTISILGENDPELSTEPVIIRPFITHQQFAKETSGLCTSQSVAAALDDDPTINSFPDVEAELRKRNLLLHSTESVYQDLQDEDKKPSHEKTKPTKMPTYSTSSSDNLEQEMQKLGITWASSMIKKGKIATALSTSSSSSSSLSANEESMGKIKSFNPKVNATSNANATNLSDKSPGKPLNLKEFLARELLKRSNSLSSSSVHDDSTLASQFLRSLLGSSSDNSSKMSAGLVYTSERHRTSTPVKDLRPSTPGRPPMIPIDETETSRSKSATYHMFSGESGLSSVRGSTATSSDKENVTSRDGSSNGAQLKMPNQQLMRSGTNSSSS